MLPMYRMVKSDQRLEGYETVQVPNGRHYPQYEQPAPSQEVKINIQPGEMC